MIFLQIKEALRNLKTNKLRSVLAMLGILVGTGSVVAMVSVGKLATHEALEQFKVLGTNLMAVSISAPPNALVALDQPAAMALEKIETIRKVAPYNTLYLPIHYQGESLRGVLIGATESLQSVIHIATAKGRFISDLDKSSLFCVVGKTVYNAMKKISLRDPIGQQIQLGNALFTVIGIADHWQENSFFFQNINHAIILPLATSQLVTKNAAIRHLVFDLVNDAPIDTTENSIRTHLSETIPDAKLLFRSAKQIIEGMQKQSRIFTWLLGLIGSIVLLVGGIGVMNIMLVSVVERRREIGIRKALGATRAMIRSLFLIESVTLAVFGSLLGIAVGLLATFIITKFTHWQFVFFLSPLIVGFGVSVAVGVFFGFYPAHKAARASAIDCLRSN